MFNPAFLSGRFVHVASGSLLSESDDYSAIVGEIIRWIVDHPNQSFVAGDHCIRDKRGEYPDQHVIAVNYHYPIDGNWCAHSRQIKSIDMQESARIRRYWVSEKNADGSMYSVFCS